MKRAIYPWSFDPVTKWHLDMIQRSAEKSDTLIVWVGKNADKNYMFSFPEKVRLLEWAIKSGINDTLNIQVESFSWLLVDHAYKQEIDTIIKGVRNSTDVSYEEMLHRAGETQELWIDTIMLFASQDKTHVSSSMARWILKVQWDINDFVTLNVKHALEARLMWQYLVWVTWTIWSWKSYITQQLVELGLENNIETHDIDLDKIGHYILCEWCDPVYIKIRQKLVETFWSEILWEDWFVDRKVLWPIVFWDSNKLKQLDEILKTPIQLQIREEMKDKKWLLLLNWALLAESWTTNLTNNNSVVIWVDSKIQEKRLTWRWHNSDEIKRRINSQFSSLEKQEIIEEEIHNTKYGKLLPFINNGDNALEIEQMFFQMLSNVDIYWELRIKSVLHELWISGKFQEIYNSLKLQYDAPERAYHNWSHIVDCLDKLYQVKHVITQEDFHKIFFSILYHDVIYNPQAKLQRNEIESAQVAKEALEKLNLPENIIHRVVDLITKTADHNVSSDIEAYMMDIDMSILWSDWERYLQYSQQVRQEYSSFSNDQYKQGRLHFLQWLLNKKIFYTEYFDKKYTDQARDNIQKEIVMLES